MVPPPGAAGWYAFQARLSKTIGAIVHRDPPSRIRKFPRTV